MEWFYSLVPSVVTPSSEALDLEGLFELTGRPSRAFFLASHVASGTVDTQGYRLMVKRQQKS